MQTLSITPLGQAVSQDRALPFFNGLLQGRKRKDADHSLVNFSLQPKASKGEPHISHASLLYKHPSGAQAF